MDLRPCKSEKRLMCKSSFTEYNRRYSRFVLSFLLILSEMVSVAIGIPSDAVARQFSTIKKISVAVPEDSPPFFFVDDDDTVKGLVVDQWRLWSQKTGIPIDYRPGTWADTLEWMKTGTVDAHAGLLRTEERATYIDYILPISHTNIAVFTHHSITGISSINELKGFLIGVVQGTYSEFFFKQNLPDAALICYPDTNLMFEAAGRKDIRIFVRSMESAIWGMRRIGMETAYQTHPNLIFNRRDLFIGVPDGREGVADVLRDGMALITSEELKEIRSIWGVGEEIKDDGILRIAIHHYMPPLTFTDREQRPVGLLVDIWRLWAEKTGKEIEFLSTPWADTLENLKSGKADIHAGLYFSKERSGWLSFSQAIYESDASIFYPVKDAAIFQLGQLAGKKVGAVDKTFHKSYLEKYYPEIIVKSYPTTKDMVEAIEKKDIAAFFAVPCLTSRILTEMGLNGAYDRMDERHGSQKFRAGVLKKNEALLSLVDIGLSKITHAELAEIEKRWIPDPRERFFLGHKNEIRLTRTEEDWLGSHPVWRLAVAEHREPYIIIGSNPAPSGIIFDYVKLLSQRLGVKIEPHIVSQADFSDGLIPEGYDLVIGMETSDRHCKAVISDKLLTVSHVVVNRSDESFISNIREVSGKTVAVVDKTVVFDHIQSAFPDIKTIGVKNSLDALERTSAGTLAAAVCDLNIAGYLIADRQMANLKIAAPFQAPEVSLRFCMSESRHMLSLLNKAIHTISARDHEQIIQKWHRVRYEKGMDWGILLKWVLIVAAVFFLILGVILYWNRRLAIEVTERKNAQAALKESQERYRGIFEATKSGIFVCQAVDGGDDFVVTKFNPAAERIERIRQEAVIGKRVSEIFPGYETMGLLALYRQVYRSGESKLHPVSLYEDERISGWREYFVYKLASHEIVTVYSDETKRKEDEIDKERLTAQLHQSQKMETIGTLAGGIAHDFNNLLGIIMGNIELVVDDRSDPEMVLEQMSEALKACLRAKNVVRQLLHFSRSGGETKEPIRLDELIRDSEKLIRSVFPSTIDIQMEIRVKSGMVLANATQMHQVLLNLCTNASHAMEGTGGQLIIRLSEVHLTAEDTRHLNGLTPGDFLNLSISDTGIGLSPGIEERIFDPYFTTKDVGKGTGMGLAIVAGVVRDHDGFITVDSKPGRKTTFTILLPALQGETPAGRASMQEA